MSIITYPLDNTDYSAEDAALFHCTRNSGIYAQEDFSFSVTGEDNFITVGPGLAWLRPSRFRGLAAAMKSKTTVDLGLADNLYPRIDRVALCYDANKNTTDLVIRHGTAQDVPAPPKRSTSEFLYELHLIQIYRKPGASVITAADLTDLRLNGSCCGLMADSVTKIELDSVYAQASAILSAIKSELADLEAGTAVELKKLLFSDTVVPASSFAADETHEDYPYMAEIPLPDVLSTMIPSVTLSLEDVMDGNFAPVAESYDGGIRIYAIDVPDNDVTIPTIMLWRENA